MKKIRNIVLYLSLIVVCMGLLSAGEPIENSQLDKKEIRKLKKNDRQQYKLKQRLAKTKKEKKKKRLHQKIDKLEQEHKKLSDGAAGVGIGLGISAIVLVLASIIAGLILAILGGLGGIIIGVILVLVCLLIALGFALAALLIGINTENKTSKILGIVGLSISGVMLLIFLIMWLGAL